MVLWHNGHDHSRVGGWHSELVVDQNCVGFKVLLDSVVLQEYSTADEICMEVLDDYCLELHFPSIPKERFHYFTDCRQFSYSIC